jgi:hypothetical protein
VRLLQALFWLFFLSPRHQKYSHASFDDECCPRHMLSEPMGSGFPGQL